MSATPPSYQFPAPLRYLLCIVGVLVFYAQFTNVLLVDVKIDGEPGNRILSAWITLLDLQQHAPAKILLPSRERITSLIPQTLLAAAAGSFSFFVFAGVRQRRFYGIASVLCIPFSVVATLFNAMSGFDLDIDDPGPFGLNTLPLSPGRIEVLFGLQVPLVFYLIMFLIMLCFVVAQIVAALWDRPISKSAPASE